MRTVRYQRSVAYHMERDINLSNSLLRAVADRLMDTPDFSKDWSVYVCMNNTIILRDESCDITFELLELDCYDNGAYLEEIYGGIQDDDSGGGKVFNWDGSEL